jgi:hypothetical protein
MLVLLDDQQLGVLRTKVVTDVHLDDPKHSATKGDGHAGVPLRNFVASKVHALEVPHAASTVKRVRTDLS